MTTASLKSANPKPAKRASKRTQTTVSATGSSEVVPRSRPIRSKVSHKLTHEASTDALLKIGFSERLLNVLGPMFEVNVADARRHLPRMIRSCADGQGFVIGNAKSAASPRAILIGTAVLERLIQEAASPDISPLPRRNEDGIAL